MDQAATGLLDRGSAESIEAATMRRIARRFLPLLALSYIVSMLDRVNVGFAALTANRDLHLSASAYGWGAGIFFIGYFLFEYPSNQILARVGARLWLARIMVTWGVISAAMVFVVGPLSFFAVRFLLGVAEAGFFPGILLFMSMWFPRRYRARYLGLVLIGMPFSALIGAPISGMLLKLDGVMGLHGWQWLYIVEALPAVILGVAVLFVLTDRPEDATWLTPREKNWLRTELASDPAPVHHGETTLLAMITNRRVLFYGLIFFNVTAAAFGLVFWLPQIVHATGLTPTQSSFVTAIPYAFGAMAMIVWARVSDWTGDRIWTTAAATFAAAAGLLLSVIVATPVLQLCTMCIATMGIYALKGPNLSLLTESFSGRAAAGGIALVSAIGNLSGFLPPFIVGWIKDETGGFTGGLIFLAVLSFLGGLQVLLTPWFERREALRIHG
jgi:MFS transporter, ACS family, tartrate transporter